MTRSTTWLAVAVALLGVSASAARAQTLYGISEGGTLITINTTTGAATVVAGGLPQFTFGLAFRGAQLYTWNPVLNRIQEISPTTGAILSTIDIGLTLSGEGDIAFRSDGMGFLASSGPTAQLIRFDITVPNSTVVGPLTTQSIDGLAFNGASVLYGLSTTGVATLHTINQTTAAVTLVGSTGFLPPGPGGALGGLAFDSSGNLFAALSADLANPGILYSVNPATGVATLIGSSFSELCGLSFGTAPTPGVTIVQSGGSTNVTEGGATDTYTVVLNTPPTANVTITLNPGTQVTVAPATLTFTPANWNTAQTVTVTAVNDVVVEGAHTGTITHTAASTDAAYNGVIIAGVLVNITDNDTGPSTGGGEGSYAGSNGVGPRPEGEYGLGGARARNPILLGPFANAPGDLRVVNVAHGLRIQAAKPDEEPSVPGWSIAVTALVLALGGVLLAKKAVQ